MPARIVRCGIDLGGTKIEIAVLDTGGAVIARERVATPAGDYDATVRAIGGLVETIEAQTGASIGRLGVGMPGSLSPATGLIRNANSTCLNGRPLDRDLAAATGREVRLENDANCFALAEARAGAAAGADTVFGVILGTGVGGGIVTGGRVLAGRNRIAGEWGHNPLPGGGDGESAPPDCYCGRRGCVEAWCSGPALSADHRRRTGTAVDAQGIADLAAAGNPAARQTLELHLDRLARALAGVVNILDPDVIVLGGGLSNLSHLPERLPGAMRRHVFSDTFETRVVRNALGDSAGVIGAAWLWPAEDT